MTIVSMSDAADATVPWDRVVDEGSFKKMVLVPTLCGKLDATIERVPDSTIRDLVTLSKHDGLDLQAKLAELGDRLTAIEARVAELKALRSGGGAPPPFDRAALVAEVCAAVRTSAVNRLFANRV